MEVESLEKFIDEIRDGSEYCGCVRTKELDVALDIAETIMKSRSSAKITIEYESSKTLLTFPIWLIYWEEV